MINVRHLSKHYSAVKAVDDISFDVAAGENLILLGTSGCGKTTTLKMLNRLIEPSSGQVLINGQDISQQPAERLRLNMGYVLQNNGLFPHYTVEQNIAVVPRLLKWNTAQIKKRLHVLLEKLHLSTDFLTKYPAQLSGGQQQRVGLARALMADAPVLLMDEPFGALDNITRGKIQHEFKQLDELQRKTIVMVTHDVQEAFELGNRICLMDKGRIMQLGTPADLLLNPANQFVKDFLQGQHLQLELSTLTLAHIWTYLPAANSSAVALSPASSVWQAMETLRQRPGQQYSVQQNGQTKAVSFEPLMAAFNRFKNTYHTAGHE